ARALMLGFYRQLRTAAVVKNAKATKAEALRQAALSVMKNPQTTHPFYWAGFVLVGDGRSKRQVLYNSGRKACLIVFQFERCKPRNGAYRAITFLISGSDNPFACCRSPNVTPGIELTSSPANPSRSCSMMAGDNSFSAPVVSFLKFSISLIETNPSRLAS